MSPKVVFLHGAAGAASFSKWFDPLNVALNRLGLPALGAEEVVAPDYHSALTCDSGADPVDLNTCPPGPATRSRRDAFSRRQVQRRNLLIQYSDAHIGGWRAHPLLGSALVEFHGVARRYFRDSERRSAVLAHVGRSMPSRGRFVLVGHSLGSAVAVDLVPLLTRRIRSQSHLLGQSARIHRGSARGITIDVAGTTVPVRQGRLLGEHLQP